VTSNDWLALTFGLGITILGFLWDHRVDLAALLGLAILLMILNNTASILEALWQIYEILKEEHERHEDD